MWRARASDGTDASSWVDFGGATDFTIRTGTPLIHNSTNVGSASYGTWGVSGGKYGEFVCETCHTQRR
jgi:hypothetical protein